MAELVNEFKYSISDLTLILLLSQYSITNIAACETAFLLPLALNDGASKPPSYRLYSSAKLLILTVYTDSIYRFDGFYGIISAPHLTYFDTDYDTEVLKKTDF